MASIYKEIIINAETQNVWDVVRDVGNVHTRFVPGYAASTAIEGDMRILTMANGHIVTEYIVSIDNQALRLAYAVKESQMPLVYHHASFQVIPEDSSRCKLVWITDFLPDALKPEIQARVDRGITVMKQTIEKQFL